MGVMPFLAACHACVLMLYCVVTIVCYVCSFEWQIKFSLSLRKIGRGPGLAQLPKIDGSL